MFGVHSRPPTVIRPVRSVAVHHSKRKLALLVSVFATCGSVTVHVQSTSLENS